MAWSGWRRLVALQALCLAAAGTAGAADGSADGGANPAAGADPLPAGAGFVRLELVERAQVSGREIQLGDVARLVEGDPSVWEQLRRVAVGAVPLPGDARTLSAGQIELRLRRARVDVRTLRWVGSNRSVAVTGAGMPVDGELVRTAIARYLAGRAKAADGPASVLSVASVEWDASLQVPPGVLSAEVVAGPPALRPGPAVFSVELRSSGVPAARVWVRALVEEPAPAARSPADEAQDLAGAPGGAAQPAEATVSAGSPLWLLVRRGAVAVTAPAVARSGGRVGDTIEAASTLSGRSVFAVLVSPQWAVALGPTDEATQAELRR